MACICELGLWRLILVWMFLVAGGCQGVQPVVKQTEGALEAIPSVILGPGDGIEIKFFYNPELNDTQTVRPDGKITLQLVGDVLVRGRTPEELRDHLITIYASELRTLEIVVIVRSLSDRRIYVGGEVNKPGMIAMPGRLTALEAIMEAGGFRIETAKVKNVVVIRHKDGKYAGSLLDFREALEGKEVHPFFLNPRDIVYVPQTTIVKVDQWVDQYLYKLLPISRAGVGVSFTPGQ